MRLSPGDRVITECGAGKILSIEPDGRMVVVMLDKGVEVAVETKNVKPNEGGKNVKNNFRTCPEHDSRQSKRTAPQKRGKT